MCPAGVFFANISKFETKSKVIMNASEFCDMDGVVIKYSAFWPPCAISEI